MNTEEIAVIAEEAYAIDIDASQVTLGGYGKPGEPSGRQVFYGSMYLGRIHRGRFVADSKNWENATPDREEFRIHRARRGGCVIEVRGVVVAITTGDRFYARTLVSDPVFRKEAASWLASLQVAATQEP